MLAETIRKQNVIADQLTIHADRGTSMASKPVALLLADLGVTKSHSRPHCSNDNPYSEAQFKTLKYRPEFPGRFGAIQDGRAFCQRFTGTTMSTAIPASAFTPQPLSTSGALKASSSSVPVCCKQPTPLTPNALSARHRPTAIAWTSLDQQAHGGLASTVIVAPTGLTRVDRVPLSRASMLAALSNARLRA